MNGLLLGLDHLTVVDTTPAQLAHAAHAVGCGTVCLFLEPMAVLPRMPFFDLYTDPEQRQMLKAAMDDCGLALDLAYPFTLTGRSVAAAFEPAIACAADLGAKAVNVLAYDREPSRRAETFARFCELVLAHGLGVVVEFYPLSQVRTLADALALVTPVGRPGRVGVNVDLLHLVRSGGAVQDVAAAPAGTILYAQFCDGPFRCDPLQLDFEASSQRALAGGGVFDIAGFAGVLPAGCRCSVELPQDDALAAGVPPAERARRAVESVRAAVKRGAG